MLKQIPDKTGLGTAASLYRKLPGPLSDAPDNQDFMLRTVLEMAVERIDGVEHKKWERLQDAAAAAVPGGERADGTAIDPRSLNFVLPRIQTSADEPPFLASVVVIADPEDASRLARRHTKKQPNFTPLFFQSLIATTDNSHWRTQRTHLNEVFLPGLSLAKIFPTSWARAKKCADIMGQLAAAAGEDGVQVHEFFLHEAQAQLQMALFGMDEGFMESTNKPIRDAFSGINPDPNYAKDMCLTMLEKVGESDRFSTASESSATGKPVFGPLSKSVATAGTELNLNMKDQFGNMMLILFAGHDTTAHTMTWMTYELARHPEHQARLHAEVDRFFDELGDRDMVYDDCSKLPFLTRCVMETLRLWPAVATGTYRELQFADTVKGLDGTPVELPKGTYVQVQTWTRHRSKALWGPDADVFNPDRAFVGSEVWDGHSFKGYNPATPRFSPFTYEPRDCLGKNFAHMEMRTIMANVFRKFDFSLSDAYANHDAERDGPLENFQGTLAPRNITEAGKKEAGRRKEKSERPPCAMYLKVAPRVLRSAGGDVHHPQAKL